MNFGKKSQEALDAEFLQAVGDFKFEKAKSLLEKGATVLAQDDKGDTAFHKLALGDAGKKGSDCYRKTYYKQRVDYSIADSFVCFLLKRKLGIDTPNNEGQTALHLVTDHHMQEILLNRGADPKVADKAGWTPLFYIAYRGMKYSWDEEGIRRLLKGGAQIDSRNSRGETVLHIAASRGRESTAEKLLKLAPHLIAMQDKQGNYPHDSAVAGDVGHHDLARDLRQKFDVYTSAGKEQTSTSGKEMIPAPQQAVVRDDGWTLLNSDRIEHTEETSTYLLTEIFNFRTRIYTQIAHNLETQSDTPPATKCFDDFSDKSLLREAYNALSRLGGKADESSIEGSPLPGKPAAQLRLE
jgi:hypothetical protein